jgi:RNA polymerase sigma factor (sigma-70 family)
MMPELDNRFQVLMQEALTGSDGAAQELFEHYEPLLLKAIRMKLNKNVRSKFDSMDFSQDVWASFFAEPPANRVFQDAEHLLNFLVKIARNKVAAAMRQRLILQKHNVNREQSIDDSRRFNKEDLPAAQATPSQIVMTNEDFNTFLKKQPLVYQRIFVMLRSGHSHEQIAEQLGINVRTVERVVAKFAAGPVL